MVWYGMVWYGMVWYGMVWYGMVWYGMVWYGMVWYGMVWYGSGGRKQGESGPRRSPNRWSLQPAPPTPPPSRTGRVTLPPAAGEGSRVTHTGGTSLLLARAPPPPPRHGAPPPPSVVVGTRLASVTPAGCSLAPCPGRACLAISPAGTCWVPQQQQRQQQHTIPYHTIPYHTIPACGGSCGACTAQLVRPWRAGVPVGPAQHSWCGPGVWGFLWGLHSTAGAALACGGSCGACTAQLVRPWRAVRFPWGRHSTAGAAPARGGRK